ncbi:MAG: putative toxin-antitoxin system toxin component, PIN family [Acidimicrobiales bacterium]
MRAVLDPNVLISALLSRNGSPAELVRAWFDGGFELVVSPLLLGELERALGYWKLRTRISPAEAAQFLYLLRQQARMTQDPTDQREVRSPDPGDDYLIALAAATRSAIVSGDGHLLCLASRIPVHSAAFLALLRDFSDH